MGPDRRPWSPTLNDEAIATAIRIGTAAGRRAARNVSRETKPRGPNSLRYSSAAWDASAAAWTLASLIDLLGEEAAETEQAGYIRDAIAALQKFIDAEQAEIGTPADTAESAADMTFVEETISVTAWASALRAATRQAIRAAIGRFDRVLFSSPAFRDAADDAWVDAQLAKRAKWYARIAPLLEEAGPAGVVDPREALRIVSRETATIT